MNLMKIFRNSVLESHYLMGNSFIKYIRPVYSLIKYIIIISIDRIFLNLKTEIIINKI